jgi:hypothetical protein
MPRNQRKRRYTRSLPPTPCSAEMHQRMLDIAEQKQVSVAHIQRDAFAHYLTSLTKSQQDSMNNG